MERAQGNTKGDMPVRFSIVMPSYLGDYTGAAKNRPAKLLRAINSVLNQSFGSWELLVVADGCQRTMDLVAEHYGDHPRITSILIAKQALWDPGVRNVGIKHATGRWIIYLDADDYWGKDHLSIVNDGLRGIPSGWAWFNDLEWSKQRKEFVERRCDITHKDRHGTSNLVHARELGVYWTKGTYKQDAFFCDSLKRTGPGVQIPTPEYCVAHIPNRYDV